MQMFPLFYCSTVLWFPMFYCSTVPNVLLFYGSHVLLFPMFPMFPMFPLKFYPDLYIKKSLGQIIWHRELPVMKVLDPGIRNGIAGTQ